LEVIRSPPGNPDSIRVFAGGGRRISFIGSVLGPSLRGLFSVETGTLGESAAVWTFAALEDFPATIPTVVEIFKIVVK